MPKNSFRVNGDGFTAVAVSVNQSDATVGWRFSRGANHWTGVFHAPQYQAPLAMEGVSVHFGPLGDSLDYCDECDSVNVLYGNESGAYCTGCYVDDVY